MRIPRICYAVTTRTDRPGIFQHSLTWWLAGSNGACCRVSIRNGKVSITRFANGVAQDTGSVFMSPLRAQVRVVWASRNTRQRGAMTAKRSKQYFITRCAAMMREKNQGPETAYCGGYLVVVVNCCGYFGRRAGSRWGATRPPLPGWGGQKTGAHLGG